MCKETTRGINKVYIKGIGLGLCLLILLPSLLLGIQGTKEEVKAYNLVEEGKYIEARTLSEEILKDNPNSYAARYVLGRALHYGEGNLP